MKAPWTIRCVVAVANALARTRLGRELQTRLIESARSARDAQVGQAQGVPAQVAVQEIAPLVPRAATVTSPTRRLNLLIPGLSERHVFGGIATALRCFEVVQRSWAEVRIIVMDEVRAEPAAHAWYGAWPQVEMEEESPPARHVVSVGYRHLRTLPVHDGDVFFATAWWTAHAAHALIDWQQAQHNQPSPRQFAYLIQDYEPGFYAWSTRHVLAAASYQPGARIRALVNTQLLADHLAQQGHRFAQLKVFEPRLHPELAQRRARAPSWAKEPIIFVYGRPGTERNAFGLILMALRQWVDQDPQRAAQWRVVTAGEPFEDLDLGHGQVLHNLGKLSLESYAQWLERAAVGVALMVSPHPSYPPLEMAAFGARVITNGFAGKNLAHWSGRITSLTAPSPISLAQALAQVCQAFAAQPPEQRAVRAQDCALAGPFLEPGEEAQGLEHFLADLQEAQA